MQRRVIVAAAIAAISLLSCGAVRLAQMRGEALEQAEEDFIAWRPDANAIRRGLPVEKSLLASEPPFGQYHQRFKSMFQDRFRRHDPQLAVGIQFLDHRRVLLKVPARLEPWRTDHIAVSLWREIQEDFGARPDIDIYATYIGAPPRKIGKLRATLGRPQFATITYFPPNRPGAH